MPRFQQRSESARSAHTGATAASTPRTARPLRRRLGPATRRPGPRLRPPGPRAALAPPPGPGPPVPPSRKPRGGRPAGFAASRRGSGGNTRDAPAAGPTGRPSGSGTRPAEEAAPGRRPRPHSRAGGTGRGRCYLGARPLLPAPLSWQPRQRHAGREPDGLVTAPSVHRARAHAGVDVRGPPSPPPVRSAPPGARGRRSALKRTVAEAAHRHQ